MIVLVLGAVDAGLAQSLTRPILAQYLSADQVEKGGGQLPISVRSLQDDDSIFLLDAPSPRGHRYLALNSLGRSSRRPEEIMQAIKADVNRAFPYFDAAAPCGHGFRVGDTYTLSVHVEGTDLENLKYLAGANPERVPVRVTSSGRYHFTFETLPGHKLRGTATHGVFRDVTGELWLFQDGMGVADEPRGLQADNYRLAQIMWPRMAQNIKSMMTGRDHVYTVQARTNTGLHVCPGDSIRVSAEGSMTIDTLRMFRVGPEGLPYPQFAMFNYDFAERCNHGSLVLLIVQDEQLATHACVGRGVTLTAKAEGTLHLWVNDWDHLNNVGTFEATVVITRAR